MGMRQLERLLGSLTRDDARLPHYDTRGNALRAEEAGDTSLERARPPGWSEATELPQVPDYARQSYNWEDPALFDQMSTPDRWRNLENLAHGVATSEGAEGRQAAVAQLADAIRNEFVPQADLQAYLGRTDVPAEEKTATLGQISVERGRAELLLGRAHVGGEGTWEVAPDRGAFPDYYQDLVQTYGRGGDTGAYWCTSFAGAMNAMNGFEFADEGSEARSIFWSGYRFNLWAGRGQLNGGSQVTAEGNRLGDEQLGNVHIQGQQWGQLRRSLQGAGDDAGRVAALQSWLEGNHTPQPGDIIVLDSNNAVNGGSHTVMVESYDAATHTITTVEGNANQRVTSRTINLLDPGEVSGIATLGRLGANHFEGFQHATGELGAGGPTSDPNGSNITGQYLIDYAQSQVHLLHNLMASQGWVEGGTVGTDSAHAWVHGSGEGPGTIETR
jgi:hypothetical protein